MRNIKMYKNCRGSILVGSVALAILMAIAGMGFLLVTTNGINSETAALENEKAFHAAESGVWLAARWLRKYMNNPAAVANFANTPIPINDMKLYVTITKVGNPPVATITSEVYKGSKNAASFKKRIKVGYVTCLNFGIYGTFYDGFQPGNINDWNAATGSWKTATDPTITWLGWGGRIFRGRVHMNSMPCKLFDNTPRFFGLVTIAAGNGQENFGIGHYGNDYNYGVQGNPGNAWGAPYVPTLAELDDIFPDRYIPEVNPVALNVPGNEANTLNATLPASVRINLPQSDRDEGYGPYQYRPTLYFNGSNAFYEYYNSSASPRYQRITYNNIDGRVFLSLANNLNVYSTGNNVIGRVTVATAGGRSIVPVGNLVTNDYNFASGTVPQNSDNMIGLISGGFIALNKTWTRHFNGESGDATKYVSEQVTGGGAPGPDDGVGTLHINAAVMAVCQFTTSLYDGSAWNNYPVMGTEWWDGMWEQLPTNPLNKPFNDVNNKCEDYSLQLFGNHVLGGYSRTIYPGQQKWRGCGGTVSFSHDPRMYQRNLQPPGFPGVSNTNGLMTLQMKDWKEENTY